MEAALRTAYEVITGSTLEKIPGVGEARRKQLLRHYGSIKAIRRADLGDLENVLPKPTAKAVYEYFRNENTDSGEKNQKV